MDTKSLSNMRIWHTAFLAGIILLGGCGKDERYNTPHPDKGAVQITTDWTDALSPATIPHDYCLCMDGGAAEHVGEKVCCYPDLLEPGKHTLLIHNEPRGITISGTKATVNLLEDGTLEPLPEYLFSAVKELDVVADDTLRVTVPMERHICPIVLDVNLRGDNTENIARIDATLSGIVSSVDMQSGIIGSENLSVDMDIRQVEEKTRTYTEGVLELKCRVVGVNPAERQLLTMTITMKDGSIFIIESDLTDNLKDLNTGMEPIELEGTVDTPQEGHFGGTITDWKPGNGGGENVEVH